MSLSPVLDKQFRFSFLLRYTGDKLIRFINHTCLSFVKKSIITFCNSLSNQKSVELCVTGPIFVDKY